MPYRFDSPQAAAKVREKMDEILSEIATKLKAEFNDRLKREEVRFIVETEVVNPS